MNYKPQVVREHGGVSDEDVINKTVEVVLRGRYNNIFKFLGNHVDEEQ